MNASNFIDLELELGLNKVQLFVEFVPFELEDGADLAQLPPDGIECVFESEAARGLTSSLTSAAVIFRLLRRHRKETASTH